MSYITNLQTGARNHNPPLISRYSPYSPIGLKLGFEGQNRYISALPRPQPQNSSTQRTFVRMGSNLSFTQFTMAQKVDYCNQAMRIYAHNGQWAMGSDLLSTMDQRNIATNATTF